MLASGGHPLLMAPKIPSYLNLIPLKWDEDESIPFSSKQSKCKLMLKVSINMSHEIKL